MENTEIKNETPTVRIIDKETAEVIKAKRAKKKPMTEYLPLIEQIKVGKAEGKSVWQMCVQIANANPGFGPKTLMAKYYECLRKEKSNNEQSTNN